VRFFCELFLLEESWDAGKSHQNFFTEEEWFFCDLLLLEGMWYVCNLN
jgi:hypothetical protein